MSTIEVLSPGLLSTVQDLGREGFGPMGVSPSGAADPIALRIGNLLVGNSEGAAGLEMTLLGGAFQFDRACVFALTGSDFGATLEGVAIPCWASFEIKSGQRLRLGPTRSGARCYLCVQGGIQVKPFLGSASTHLLSGLGGHEGRALRKADVLKIGDATETVQKGTGKSASTEGAYGSSGTGIPACSSSLNVGGSHYPRRISAAAMKRLAPRKVLRVTPGPQSAWFTKASRKMFYANGYGVTEEANRMGLRLDGRSLPQGAHGEMISEGVSLGAIQIAAGGLPIILFVEQQTTGGYAKIANVISADLHSLGQLRPRDEIRFDLVSFATARKLLTAQEQLLASKQLIG